MGDSAFERIRARRIRAERAFARALAEANPGRVMLLAGEGGEAVEMSLPDVPCYDLADQATEGVEVRFEFPEYYPSVPLEAYLKPPVRHPNVHPVTGFVCLWTRQHNGTALVEAVLQLRKVVSWNMSNAGADHLMQPEAGQMEALALRPLAVPPEYHLERTAGRLSGPRRNRLS